MKIVGAVTALSSIVESRLLCDLGSVRAGAAAKKFRRAVVTAGLFGELGVLCVGVGEKP